MIGIMRKLINNKSYKVILWLFLVMMAVGSGLVLNIGSEKKWVIKVYNELLSQAELDRFVKAEKNQQEEYRRRNIFINGKNIEKDGVMKGLNKLFVEHVINGLHVEVSEKSIDQKVQQFFSTLPKEFFRADGSLDEELFARQIKPLTIEGFMELFVLEAKNDLFAAIIDAGAYTPGFELGIKYATEYAKKDYSVLKFPMQKYVEKARSESPSTEALEKFYKKAKNNEQFKTTEKRSGNVWKFSQRDYNVSVTEGDIKKDYDKNKSKYLLAPSQMQLRILVVAVEPGQEDAAREKADDLHKQAEQNPDNFAAMVKDSSDAKNVAKTGGLTKMFTEDDTDLDKVVVKTAFESLITDGQISAPIKTKEGYELLQRVKKVPAQYKDLKSVSEEIRTELSSSKFKQRFMQDANRAVSQARYNPELLANLTKKGQEAKLPLSENKSGDAVIAQLFKAEEQKYVAFFDKNMGYVVQCTQIEKSRIPALEEVKHAVLVKYYHQEGLQLLQDAMSKALQELRSGAEIQAVAHEFGVKVEPAHFEYKNETADQSPILTGGDVQAQLKTLSHEGAFTSVTTDQNGLIIRLDRLEALDQKDLKKQKEEFAKSLSYAKKYKVKEGFIASLYRRAKLDNKIEIKPEVLHLLKEA